MVYLSIHLLKDISVILQFWQLWIKALFCCCWVAQSCSTLCDPVDCITPAFLVLHHLPKLVQTHVHWVGDAIQPSHALPSPSPPVLNLSQYQGLFKWVSSLHHVAKVLDLQLQHLSFQWILGVDSFRISWFDLLAVQGTLKNLLQHHSSKTSILWLSAFFMVQHSHPHMTIGKTIALIIWTFFGKVMSLLFNTLSRFVIVFLPRSKHLLISLLQSSSPVILEPKKIVCHCFHCFRIYLPWNDGTRCHSLCFFNVEF